MPLNLIRGFEATSKIYQVAVNVREFRGGERVSNNLEINDIIINMNMLPHEPLKAHDHPDGIRIGVQEMTRYGMGVMGMERIAELMKECIIDKKPVKDNIMMVFKFYRLNWLNPVSQRPSPGNRQT